MNCHLFDKKLGVYFCAFKAHSPNRNLAALLNVERAIKLNASFNNRYNIQLVLFNPYEQAK